MEGGDGENREIVGGGRLIEERKTRGSPINGRGELRTKQRRTKEGRNRDRGDGDRGNVEENIPQRLAMLSGGSGDGGKVLQQKESLVIREVAIANEKREGRRVGGPITENGREIGERKDNEGNAKGRKTEKGGDRSVQVQTQSEESGGEKKHPYGFWSVCASVPSSH